MSDLEANQSRAAEDRLHASVRLNSLEDNTGGHEGGLGNLQAAERQQQNS